METKTKGTKTAVAKNREVLKAKATEKAQKAKRATKEAEEEGGEKKKKGKIKAGDTVTFTPHPNLGMSEKSLTGEVKKIMNGLTNDPNNTYAAIEVKKLGRVFHKKVQACVKVA